MKSVEFLIVVFLLLSAYAPMYVTSKGYVDASERALEDFNLTLRYRHANSLVGNLKSYGEPFVYEDFGRLDPSLIDGVEYDPLLNKFMYETYSRW